MRANIHVAMASSGYDRVHVPTHTQIHPIQLNDWLCRILGNYNTRIHSL